ncbi:MAG: hypothetical protein M3Z54_11810, partial [Gemmatimonadota bacterium]|nr:hypothetical protein [Gemmatimonadota bacterium]
MTRRQSLLETLFSALRIAAIGALACATLGPISCTHVTSQSNILSRHLWTQPGLLRWGEYTEPDTLNPLLSSLQVTVEESMLWAGYLFEYDDKNEYVPDLATEMPTLQNGGISR